MDNERIEFKFLTFHIISKYMAEMPANRAISSPFTFEVKVEDKVQAERKCVLVFVHVKIFDSSEKSNLVGSLSTISFFEIIDFEKFIVLNETGKYTIPPRLDLTIRPVCISTTRGVIYSEFRGTYLQPALMPIMFMSDFETLDDEAVTDIEKK
jgi:hypothetical protein